MTHRDHVDRQAKPGPGVVGDLIEFRFGDGGDGSHGARVQTFIEEASPLSVRVCFGPDGRWTEIGLLEVEVTGTAAVALVASAPSRVAVGEPFQVHLRVEDEWGNPAAGFEGDFDIHGALSAGGRVRSADGSFTRVDAVLDQAGVHRLQVSQRGGDLTAVSNPIICEMQPDERLFWGDMHAQSLVGCGARSVTNYYRHARDFAGCDVASHQANCYMVTTPEWQETASVTREFHEPGRFVPLLGVEWSAISPRGGDRNLYFPGDAAELHRCSHEFVADRSDVGTDLPSADDLHAHYRDRDVVVALHVGGRTTDLRWHEPAVERLIEVHSTHATSEWFLLDAITRGYRMGVIAGSDGVDGRPGASHPGHMAVRNVRGGLTAFALPELSRDALWAGMRERRCYATTGDRIFLDFDCDGHPYGTEYEANGAPTIRYRVEGTGPLDTVEIWRDTSLLHQVAIEPTDPTPSDAIRIAWRGSSAEGNWRRARMAWHGYARLSGGSISDVSGYAFDTPDEGIVEYDAGTVSWRSVTAGDWDGVVLRLQPGWESDAHLEFATDPMKLTIPLEQLSEGPVVAEAADPARTVRVQRLPTGLPAPSCAGSFIDPDARSGSHAYWLRVLQHDGAQAWSSPVFVTFPDETAGS
jgi:hypothetical protein